MRCYSIQQGWLAVARLTDLPGWSEPTAVWHNMTGSTPSLERSHTGPPIARDTHRAALEHKDRCSKLS